VEENAIEGLELEDELRGKLGVSKAQAERFLHRPHRLHRLEWLNRSRLKRAE
jgi:hypothetical protein